MPLPSDLGDFLRSRREQLSPGDVGLRDSGRRRTPGLRREEVATLAGVSIDYLVRLEQGRDANPSRDVLASLAAALQLSHVERKHLMMLAAVGNRTDLCESGDHASSTIPLTVRGLIERLEPTPAFVIGPYSDVLGWNDAWGRLVDPLGLLEGDPPNLARFTFENPEAPTVYPGWDAAADEQVGMLRRASVRWRADPRLVTLLDDLHQLAEFERRWSNHDVADKRRGTKMLRHPDHGELHVAYEVLLLPDDGDEQRLVTWLPADDATNKVLLSQAARAPAPVSPARLHVVAQR
jgi:transcriptional regulator with XRE-family HTH domain